LGQELIVSEVGQGLVRADGVVGVFPSLKLAVEPGNRERAGGILIELVGVGAVGALNLTVEFGRARRQDEGAQAALLTGGFAEIRFVIRSFCR